MAPFQWRRFNFFDLHRDDNADQEIAEDSTSLAQALAAEPRSRATCGALVNNDLYLGDSNGNLMEVRNNHVVSATKLFESGFVAMRVHRQRYVVAVGQEGNNDNYIKVLDLGRKDAKGCPFVIRETKVSQAAEVTVLALHSNGQLIALGFDNGQIWISRGDIIRQQQSVINRSANTRVISGSKTSKVVGLEFDFAEGEKLFVSTEKDIFVHDLLREQRTTLDHEGCLPGMTLSPRLSDSQLVVGRDEGVSFYNSESKTHYYALEGRKTSMAWFNSYLIIVSSKANNAVDDANTEDVVNVYDVQLKFLALTLPIRPVSLIIEGEGNQLLLLTRDNNIVRLSEKTLEAKLEVLYKKNFYDLAIRIAENHHKASPDHLISIHQRYADHLYSKGDYSSSISNYCKTIGYLPPSFVVKKFLDAHKIVFLTEYLHALHNAGYANEDHVTLLLNCYVKLKDSKRIDEFVFNNQDAVNDIDVEIAIKVCRQAGYIDQAIELARRRHCFDLYLSLQMEEKHNVGDSLHYICSELNFVEARKAVKKYGVALMKEKPEETTAFLKRLCTDFLQKEDKAVEKNEGKTDVVVTAPDKKDDSDNEVMAADPEDYLHLFVHHSSQMVNFLEHMLSARPSLSTYSHALVNTLLEHHLREWSVAETSLKQKVEENIMSLLRRHPKQYDEDHALMLCQTHAFAPGLLFMLEERELFTQIVRFHVTHQDGEAVLKTCRKFGPIEPQLWVRTLQILAQEGEEQMLKLTLDEVLAAVEEGKLLSASNVVRTLSKSPHATLGMVRAYLDRVLRAEDKQLEQNRRISEQYADETKVLREKLTRLRTEAVVFQATKCTACKESLELPSVHFLCLHSFHRHCFLGYSESERECPECSKRNAHIKSAIKAAEQAGINDELFHQRLADAQDDPMAVVAEFLGRGVFKNTNKAVKEYRPDFNPFDEDINSLDEARIDDHLARNPRVGSIPKTPTLSTKSSTSKTASIKSVEQSPIINRRQQTIQSAVVDDQLSLRSNLSQGETVAMQKDDSDDLNPFGDVGDDEEDDGNPFREELNNSNPFGDPNEEEANEDYDNKLNPFGSN